MFKKIDKSETMKIFNVNNSKQIVYLPSFAKSNLKIIKSVISFNSSELNNNTNFNVYAGGALIDNITVNHAVPKICIDITDELIDVLRAGLIELTIVLDIMQNTNLTLTSFECTTEYSQNKMWQSNNEYETTNVGRAGSSKINLSTGELNFVHEDIVSNNAVIPLSVSHIYNSFNANLENDEVVAHNQIAKLPNFFCGNGWKTNYHCFVVKDSSNSNLLDNEVSSNYTFVDENGNHVLFQQKYFYETQEQNKNTKHFVAPKQVNIAQDQSLTTMVDGKSVDVLSEIITNSDLRLSAKLEGFNGIKLVNTDIEEIASLKKEIIEIEKSIKDYEFNLKINGHKIALFNQSENISNMQKEIQDINFDSEKRSLNNTLNNLSYDKRSAYYNERYLKEGFGIDATNLQNANYYQFYAQNANNRMQWGTEWLEDQEHNTYQTDSLLGNRVKIFNKTETLNNANLQYSTFQLDVQRYQLQNEKEQLENIIADYNNLLKQKQFALHEYTKQVPEIYLTNASNTNFMGFSKFDTSYLNSDDFNNECEVYRLVVIGDQYENAVYVNYNDSKNNCQIKSVTDSENNSISFDYENQMLSKIIGYNKDNLCFKYNSQNNLSQIEYSDGTKTSFEYNENNEITKVTNGFGYGVNYVRSLNKINLQEFSCHSLIEKNNVQKNKNADGEEVVITKPMQSIFFYDFKSTIVTDKLGNSKTYVFDILGRPTTIYTGNFIENAPNQTKLTSVTHDYNNGKISRNVQKINNAKNLLNVFSEYYLGDDIYCGDEVYLTLNEGTPDNKVYQFDNSLILNNVHEIVVGTDIINLLNCGTKSFVFSGWANADSAYVTDTNNSINELEQFMQQNLDDSKLKRKFCLSAILHYKGDEPNVTTTLQTNFDWMQTAWQYAELPIALEKGKQLDGLKLQFNYCFNTGVVKYFGLTLTEAIIEETTYNQKGLKQSSYNSLTKATTNFYYTNNLLTKEVLSLGGLDYTSTYCYNKFGACVRSTNFNGMVQETEYNKFGLPVKTTKYNIADPTSQFTETTELNEKGKQTGETNEFGQLQTTFEYDSVSNNVVGITNKLGHSQNFGYNPQTGNLASISATSGDEENCNMFGYTLGNLTSLSHNNFAVNYAFDGFGNTTKISIDNQPNNYVENMVSDNFVVNRFGTGEVVQQNINNLGNVASVQYKPTWSTEFSTIVENTFDEKNNLTKQTQNLYGKQTQTLNNFDKFGNVIYSAVSSGVGQDQNVLQEIASTYNNFGNITSSVVAIGNDQTQYNYGYDENPNSTLNQVTITHNNCTPIKQKIEHDLLGRVKSISLDNKFSKQISYLKRGNHCSNLVGTVWHGQNGVLNNNTKYGYDDFGNINKIYENGELVASYNYDELNRLIREDNKQLNLTTTFAYDGGGNIIKKVAFAYSLKPTNMLDGGTETIYSYPLAGWRDQLALVSIYGTTKNFEYDSFGNPTTFKGKKLKFGHLRNLEQYDITNNDQTSQALATYTYNASNIRTSKTVNGITTNFYLSGNNVVALDESGTKMFFHYGADGLIGFHYDIYEYYYQKNLQNDIIGIFDKLGTQIVKYIYDAWGNAKIFVKRGNNFVNIYENNLYDDNEYKNNKLLALSNPFRYRSYYFDNESNLYYLNSRYYDPELGRFINADDIDNAMMQIDQVNGLNLYSYCLNNPVMITDPKGQFVLTAFMIALLIGIGAGAVVGGTIGGIQAANNGTSIIGGIFGGAIMGGVMGGLLVLGGGVALGVAGGITLGSGLALSAGVGIVAGWTSYSVEAGFNGNWNIQDFGKSGVSGMLKGTGTFGIGFMGGKFLGGYDKLILNSQLKGASTLDMGITYSIAKAIMGRTAFMTPLTEFILKTGIIGGIASLFRTAIDWIFNQF